MKNCGRGNFRKLRETKNGKHCIALDIYLKFSNLDKIKIKTSEPKYYLVISGKCLITSLGFKTIRRLKEIKKSGFAVTEVSIKDIYKIIMEFKDSPYEVYVSKRSKHMPTNSLSRQLVNFMMTNLRGSVRTHKKSTKKIPNSQVCSTDESKSKRTNGDKIE